jgi:hypothetical protein
VKEELRRGKRVKEELEGRRKKEESKKKVELV